MMMKKIATVAILLSSVGVVMGFAPVLPTTQQQTRTSSVTTRIAVPTKTTQRKTSSSSSSLMTILFMGRAAAVRAATKSKTDAKKAKTNAVFGKRIIMAVKSGGSPDPVSNRALADIIKQAKANNVPVENINRAIKRASEANAGDFSESTFEAYDWAGLRL
jgi:hypothetical protein